jgi:uncharacterized Zn finger protein
MVREDAKTKGKRLLTEGRLRIKWVDDLRIQALCRGDDGAVYEVGFDGSWYCTCPAASRSMSMRCSHLIALKLVAIAVEPREEPA